MIEVALVIHEKKVILSLKGVDGATTQTSWIDENNLLEKFFVNLTTLCEKGRVSKQEISEFTLESGLATGYTTQRIAMTIINALNYSIQKKASKREGWSYNC